MKGLETIDESIADPAIFAIVKEAMQQSGQALVEKFGFDRDAHFKYIDKIIGRFKNPYLKDDVTRVGREPLRKLSSTDRLVKPMMTAASTACRATNCCWVSAPHCITTIPKIRRASRCRS